MLMRAPRSFTREDVVELHCHGGLVAVRRVLELVLAAGARRALPGEFSQRAFLNGRLDLTRAEAIGEMVSARSRRAAQLAMAGIDGGLQRRLTALRGRLLDQLAELEARVDFEEDLPPLDGGAVAAELVAVRSALEQLGIERSHAALAAADVALLLFDLERGWTPQDQQLLDQLPPELPRLLVGNKADAPGLPVGAVEAAADPRLAPAQVSCSARTGAGEPELVRCLLELCGATEAQGLQVALNARQRDLAAAAAASLAGSLEAAVAQLPWDFWTIDLRAAVRSLGEITGEEVSEAVLDRVFARFCIGK
ncbi:MAG: tRNA uridine-5-carboxymethylaminomethyl(34) synthesis GTPase MnmE [Synechococcus sp.]